ncbi:MAG: molybdenum cofactor guanylyltransferase [Clostridium sp.]
MDKFKTAIILAGGNSSRMGFDKQFLNINKKRLMDIQINKLRQDFSEIIVVSNKLNQYKNVNYKVVCDEIIGIGPLGGIHAGLKNSASEYAYLIACDMPIINNDYIRFMKEKVNNNVDVCACITKRGDRIEPFNGLYSISLLDKIEENVAQKHFSIFDLLNNTNTIYIEENEAKKFNRNLDMFINLNNIEDLARGAKAWQRG